MTLTTIRALLTALVLLPLPAAYAADAPANVAPPPLSVYGGLPGVEDMSMSPDGKTLAAITRVGSVRQLLLFDEARRQLGSAPIGEAKVRGLRWAGDRVLVAMISSTTSLGPEFSRDKIELWGALVLPLGGQKARMIFEGDAAMARAVWGDYGSRTVNGHLVGYFAGIQFKRAHGEIGYEFDHGRPALFQVDLMEHRARKIAAAAPEGASRDWLVDGAGQVGATLDIMQQSGSWKLANGQGATIASGKNPYGKVRLIAFGKDGTSVVYSSEESAEAGQRWFEAPLAGGSAQEILPDARIERIFVDPANGRMLGYLQGGSSPRPILFAPAHQAQISRIYRSFAKSDMRIVEWTPDLGKFLVHTSGNGDSGTWYVVDTAAKRADPIGNDYPPILPEAVGTISTVAYKASDGLELDGILTLPPGRSGRNLPVVVLPHGGPHAHDRANFDWWAQAFASRGYAVFQPNFRGSTNRNDAFERAGYGQWGRKMQTDISDGLAELARQDIVDPKRACIVGASYGGYAALAGVTLQKGLYRCAVSVAGVSDLSDMYWTDYRESGNNQLRRRNMTESLGSPSTFAEVSPRKRARDANAPILLIHGKDDTVVPFKQSTAMLDALRDAGKPAEFVVLREEDHWLSRGATRQQMLEAAVGFVARHNPAD